MKRRARWIALTVGVVLVAFGIVLAVSHRPESAMPRLVREHRRSPTFQLETLDGKPVASSSLAGKTYVVNFFNSWCIPCHQEAPALKAFYEEHRNEADFAMVGIVHDDEASAMRSYVQDQSIRWPVLLDPNTTTALDFGTTGQPETYVIGPNGVAACGIVGPATQQLLDNWLQGVRAGQVCT